MDSIKNASAFYKRKFKRKVTHQSNIIRRALHKEQTVKNVPTVSNLQNLSKMVNWEKKSYI